MDKKGFFQRKSIGEYFSLVGAVVALIAGIYYYSYASGLGSVNGAIVVFVIGSVICSLIYVLIDAKLVFDIGIFEIAASVFLTLAFVQFLLNSWSNLADLLNGIQIFSGGRGSVKSIFTILGILLVADIIAMVSCFMKKNKA